MIQKINFACSNCLNIFDIDTIDIYFDQLRELHFIPAVECPLCGARDEVVLSNFGLIQIDHMILNNQIPIKT